MLDPAAPSAVVTFSRILSPPPDASRGPRQTGRVLLRRIDFVRLDAENRASGQPGEELAFELEQRRLQDELKRPDLARQVRWVARDEGDGLGYDIHSFEGGGEDRLIEVKTTGYVLGGALDRSCTLSPTQFRATAGAPSRD